MKNKVMKFLLCAAVCLTAIGIIIIKIDTIRAAEYGYDELGRVTKVTYEDNSTITYVYDSNGNILSVKVTEEETEKTSQIPQESTAATESGSHTDNTKEQEDHQTDENSTKHYDVAESQTDSDEDSSMAGDKAKKIGFFQKVWKEIVKFFKWLWSVIKYFFLWILSITQKLFEAVIHK